MYRLNDHRQKGIIRGKITGANAVLLDHGHAVGMVALMEESWPYTMNNMDSWLYCAIQQLGNTKFRAHVGTHKSVVLYEVNDGKGKLTGRGANQNKFSYRLVVAELHCSWDLDITIATIPHQQLYAEKVRKGEHVPTPRTVVAEPDEIYYAVTTNKVMVPWEEMPGAFMEHDPEEFFNAHPELVGKLPTREV